MRFEGVEESAKELLDAGAIRDIDFGKWVNCIISQYQLLGFPARGSHSEVCKLVKQDLELKGRRWRGIYSLTGRNALTF